MSSKFFGGGGGGAAGVARGCRLFKAADQSIPNATDTALVFDAESYDDGNLHDNAVNNTRITFSHDGEVVVFANVSLTGSIAGARRLSLRLNGTTTVAVRAAASGHTGLAFLNAFTVLRVAPGDYIEAVVFQASTIALTSFATAQAFGAQYITNPQADVGCRVSNSVAVTLPTGVETVLGCDTERYDTSALHNPAVDNSRITFPSTGKVLLVAEASIPIIGGPVSVRRARLRLNGATFVVGQSDGTGVTSATNQRIILVTVVSVAPADYAELMVVQASGLSGTAQAVAFSAQYVTAGG